MTDQDDKDAILDVASAFSNGDKTVINWEGENYYKACGEPVVANADGSGSTCVKRQDHPGDIHEDFNGVRKAEKHDKMLAVISFKTPSARVEDHERVQSIMNSLKPHFAHESEVQITLAIRERADEVLMILQGDG